MRLRELAEIESLSECPFDEREARGLSSAVAVVVFLLFQRGSRSCGRVSRAPSLWWVRFASSSSRLRAVV